MREGLTMHGSYVIELLDADGRLLERQLIDNMLMNVNVNQRAQQLMGTYEGFRDSMQIKYFAFGIGTAPVTADDVKLDREVYRKQITRISQISPGVVQSVVSLNSAECNTSIKEIGVFCGPDASSLADSGTLISRVAVSIEKNSNITLNIIRTDTCTI